ncbi:MAG: hypothetical protein IBX55_21425 [Methyloprofundus sp.]|nr:hypothetical protein [Methyloprofundus sp.]
MINETDLWANGWAFYKSENNSEDLLPLIKDSNEWIGGFCAAMADYDLEHNDSNIQNALLNKGIKGGLLEACLSAAEEVFNDNEWCRFPSVPIRN